MATPTDIELQSCCTLWQQEEVLGGRIVYNVLVEKKTLATGLAV